MLTQTLTLDVPLPTEVSPFWNLAWVQLDEKWDESRNNFKGLSTHAGINPVQEEEWYLQPLAADVCEMDGKYLVRKRGGTHSPISSIQGGLVKRSYNVFLQETALFPYFQTQQLTLLSISIAKNIR